MIIQLPKALYLLVAILAGFNSVSAQSFQGKVVVANTTQPIAGASVFLSNTSVGTVTTDKGVFTIAHFPAGRYEVVVSSIGYETQIITVSSTKIPNELVVALKPQAKLLKEVVLEPYDKNGWERWGQFFLDNFIGKSEFASDCKLLNKGAIKFHYSKKQNLLKAFADEPLLMENKALGYKVTYQLEKFEFQFNTRLFLYQGYPLFEEMQTNKERLQKRWIANREEAYYGSMMHFMRSLYRNKLIEQGFEVRKLIKVENAERARVKRIYQSQINITNSENNYFAIPADSMDYYRRVMEQPEETNYLINKVLPGDSIAQAVDSTTAGLAFADYLQVTYNKKKEPSEYYSGSGRRYGEKSVVSEIYLPNKIGIAVLANGSYFEGLNLVTSQFWAWWEKMATLLPLDYWPAKK